MKHIKYLNQKHCRWCGIEYFASQPVGRDGFCNVKHRQAHYRAYKLYVTPESRRRPVHH